MTSVEILLQQLDSELPVPSYAHPGDAGADLHSRDTVTIAPGGRALVATGIAIALPAGYVALVHPRSGLAAKQGVTVLNAPGTIDAGYRGEVKVILHNTDPSQEVTINRGDRIAQIIIQEFVQARFVMAEHLPGSDRGQGGFGSSGH